MIDVNKEIGAARRAVGGLELDGGNTRTVSITRTYNADIADVWDACTNPDRIPRWFLPISGELRVGGHYQFEGNAGGQVNRCDPPTGFAATWEFGGNVSWIDVRLTSTGSRTAFRLEHVVPADQKWDEFGPGAVGIGWELALMGLGMHLSSGAAVEPAAFMAWSASDEGARFVISSSQMWCEASILSGTDTASARAARERVTAAYTAAPAEEPPVAAE